MDRVTVFERGARVTRKAVLTGPPPDEVLLFGLPLCLIDETVRVSARGATPTLATVVLEAPGPTGALLESPSVELRQARAAAALADAELDRLRREVEAIEQTPLVAEPPKDEAPAPWAQVAAARRELGDLRARRLGELRQALVVAQRSSREAARALAAAAQDEERRSTARAPRAAELRKAVRVTLVRDTGAAPAPEVELSLEYAVAGARWVPTYVARLGGGKLELSLRASLMQRTGEDWSGVGLELSTAALDRASELPELAALRIGKRQSPPAKSYRPPPQGAEALFDDFAREVAAAPTARPEPAPKRAAATTGQPALPAELPLPAPAPQSLAAPSGPPRKELATPLGSKQPDFDDIDTGVEQARARGGAPRNQPEAKARRLAEIGAASRDLQSRSSRATPKRFGGEVMMLAAAASPGGGEDGEGGEGGGRRAIADLVPPRPVAQLDFLGLMMAGFDHPQRGQLVEMSLAVRYQLSDTAGSGYDAAALRQRLTAATQLADAVTSAALPPGTRDDWSHDFDYAFFAEGRVDVPSDGAWHSVPLATRSAPTKLRHIAVPREQADVFRITNATNPFEAPLLPGPVDVYDGNRFLVTAPLPMVAPGGELELPLGVDPQVKIARQIEYREEVTGMLRGGLRLVHEVRVEVRSHAATPIDLEVRERVPVPRERDSDEIEVKVVAAKPAWQPWEPPLSSPHEAPLRGGYAWRLTVPAHGPATLSASYEVLISAKHELIGGNRREP